jgi:uroporphyrinogen decarboxylase
MFFATQFARRDLLSDEEYVAFGERYDRVVLEALADTGALLLLHVCGSSPMLQLGDRYHADIVNWHDQTAGPSLAEGLAMRRSGAVLGGLDRERLRNCTPEEVAADVRGAVAQTGGLRLIVGAGCVTLMGTPPGNLLAVREAAHASRAR